MAACDNIVMVIAGTCIYCNTSQSFNSMLAKCAPLAVVTVENKFISKPVGLTQR